MRCVHYLTPSLSAVESCCENHGLLSRPISKVDEEREASRNNNERSSLLWTGNSVAAEEKKGKLIKAILYGVQVFYSFFIM